MKCFISRSFREEDKDVCAWFGELLTAFGDQILEAGSQPNPPRQQVNEFIDQADMLCAIVTARSGAVPQWVSYEIARASARGITVFGFVEDGIADLGSLPATMTYQTFNRKDIGGRAPEYVRYICASRMTAYLRRGTSRADLLATIETLKSQLAYDELFWNRKFD